MPWDHCDTEILDTDSCSTCGLSKQEWTIQIDATRTFSVQRRSILKIVLQEGEDQPVANEPYRVVLPDGSEREGNLDENGYVKVVSPAAGTCRVFFTERSEHGVVLIGESSADTEAEGESAPPPQTGEGEPGEDPAEQARAPSQGAGAEEGSASEEDTAPAEEQEGSAGDAAEDQAEEEFEGFECETRTRSYTFQVWDLALRLPWQPAESGETRYALNPGRDSAAIRSQASFRRYTGQTLASAWHVRQDAGDNDCGPACALFLRWGGKQAGRRTPIDANGDARWPYGATDHRPRGRDRHEITGGDVQDYCVIMRRETEQRDSDHNDDISSHDQGASMNDAKEMANEYASIFRGRVYRFEIDPGLKPEDVASRRATADQLRGRILDRLGKPRSGTGSTGRRGLMFPYISINPITRVPSRDGVGGYFHWCVVTDLSPGGSPQLPQGVSGTEWTLEIFNPARGFQTWDFYEWVLCHWEIPWPSSSFLYEVPRGRDWLIRNGDLVAELDTSDLPTYTRLTATGDAELFDYWDYADTRATQIAASWNTSVVVIECPPGTFHVAPTNANNLGTTDWDVHRDSPDGPELGHTEVDTNDSTDALILNHRSYFVSFRLYGRRVVNGRPRFNWSTTKRWNRGNPNASDNRLRGTEHTGSHRR